MIRCLSVLFELTLDVGETQVIVRRYCYFLFRMMSTKFWTTRKSNTGGKRETSTTRWASFLRTT